MVSNVFLNPESLFFLFNAYYRKMYPPSAPALSLSSQHRLGGLTLEQPIQRGKGAGLCLREEIHPFPHHEKLHL